MLKDTRRGSARACRRTRRPDAPRRSMPVRTSPPARRCPPPPGSTRSLPGRGPSRRRPARTRRGCRPRRCRGRTSRIAAAEISAVEGYRGVAQEPDGPTRTSGPRRSLHTVSAPCSPPGGGVGTLQTLHCAVVVSWSDHERACPCRGSRRPRPRASGARRRSASNAERRHLGRYVPEKGAEPLVIAIPASSSNTVFEKLFADPPLSVEISTRVPSGPRRKMSRSASRVWVIEARVHVEHAPEGTERDRGEGGRHVEDRPGNVGRG